MFSFTVVCSSRITSFPTKIQTPQFPFAYQQGKDCLWVIENTKGMILEITFKFFMLREYDEEKGCLDYLEIHEGDKKQEKYIGRFCGNNSPKKIRTKLNTLKLHFHSSEEKKFGWYMGFQAEIKEEGGLYI